MTKTAVPGLVLASASAARRQVLQGAGVEFSVDPADIDEGAVKAEMRGHGAAGELAALELAARKAKAVAARHPGALVLGADQILERAGQWFDKPADRAAARRQLQSLSGQYHRLISAMIIVENGQEVWRYVGVATLHMRELSDAFLDRYLDRVGAAALTTVGAYQLEGLGVQLFDQIDGDHFTILGLPLLPLLAFLRQRGIIPA